MAGAVGLCSATPPPPSIVQGQTIMPELPDVERFKSYEILFQARIAPDRPLGQLDEKELRKLHRTVRRVLETSIRNNAEVAKLPRTYLLRHRDSDQDGQCPRCGRELRKAKISGRGTVYCSHCQG
jgi:formamidopyrimidine-DNA glycosylase